MIPADLITNAPHRTDQRTLRSRVDLAAEVIDIEVDDVREGVSFVSVATADGTRLRVAAESIV